MSGEYLRLCAVMFAAGLGIPVMAALNGGLGRHLGGPLWAGVILLGIGFAVALTAALLLPVPAGPAPAGPGPAPAPLWAGGLFVAFYILSVTLIGPRLGIGTAIVLVLLGQMVSAALIDHFALLSMPARRLDTERAVGLALMALGTWLFSG